MPAMERRVRIVLACAATALTGCQPSGTEADGTPTTVKLVAARSASIDTYRADLNQRGRTDGKPTTIVGTLQVRRKPSAAVSADFSQFSVSGATVNDAHAVLVDGKLYLKVPVLSSTLAGGKPWLRISLTGLQTLTGIDAARITGSLLETGPATLTRMFVSATDVKTQGSETVDGVKTTHLHGTVTLEAALNNLDAAERTRAKRVYSDSGTLTFDLWADSERRPRKVALTTTGDSPLDTTVTFHYGGSVHIAAPAPDQTGGLFG
jgi:alpha-D-ribose 1-methylphosphonate 5-triphosphate synthase subunit PhnG